MDIKAAANRLKGMAMTLSSHRDLGMKNPTKNYVCTTRLS